MHKSEEDSGTFYVGVHLNHQIKVDWVRNYSYEPETYWEPSCSETISYEISIKSIGEYPLDQDVVNSLLEAGCFNDDLAELSIDMGYVDTADIEVGETDWTDLECTLAELKDEIRKAKLELI